MTAITLSRSRLVAYGMFSVPLAMAALPVYVHVPKLYAGEIGLPLALVGMILLAVRLFDAIQDPLLGYFSDRCSGHALGRAIPVILGLPLLALGFIGLFHPPQGGQATLAVWLAVNLLIVYLGFSSASISYFAMGADLSGDYHQRTRVTATRGALGLLGVLIAAAAPGLLGRGEAGNLALFSLFFVPVLLSAAWFTLRHTPRPAKRVAPEAALGSMFLPLRNARFRWLIGIFILSGIAGAIPATIILFFVQDVIQRPELSGMFLALYFVFGALGMPIWIAVSKRVGKRQAWLAGMFMSVIAFVWAYLLGSGEVLGFALVCALSGIAYGAELAIPPSMLADTVDADLLREHHGRAHQRAEHQRPDGVYFGLWQMIEKLNLAAAAGLTLPLLAWAGYEPGTAQVQAGSLAAIYALLPCAFKLVAAGMLWAAPLDRPAPLKPTLERVAKA